MRCIIIDDDPMCCKVLEKFIERASLLELKASFNDPVKALPYVNDEKIDLVFLDVEMPQLSGLEFIKTIGETSAQFILVTSHSEFALDAFEHSVTDFLVKSYSFERFMKAVMKAKNLHDKLIGKDEDSGVLFVKKGGTYTRVKKKDVLWIEAKGDYAVLNTENDRYTIHSTLKHLFELFDSKEYLRVHKSYIVRLDGIDNIEDDTISYGSKIIPIGKTYKQAVIKKLKPLS